MKNNNQSDFEVEFCAFPLKNQRGEVYHTIPAEKCRISIVSRRRLDRPDETEAAFIRGNGAWLPPVFSFIDTSNIEKLNGP